jgi:hypothetical protein
MPDGSAPVKARFLKRFTVFNLTQCEGLPEDLATAARTWVPLVATRSGYVLSRGRALGFEPRAAGGPVQFFGKAFRKFPNVSERFHQGFRKFPIVSYSFQKFHKVTEIYQ